MSTEDTFFFFDSVPVFLQTTQEEKENEKNFFYISCEFIFCNNPAVALIKYTPHWTTRGRIYILFACRNHILYCEKEQDGRNELIYWI
jgi:hypothetical protein